MATKVVRIVGNEEFCDTLGEVLEEEEITYTRKVFNAKREIEQIRTVVAPNKVATVWGLAEDVKADLVR